MIDRIKSIVRDRLGIPAWVGLVAIGALSHLALNAILRKPLTSAWGLLAPLSIGLMLESYEIWVQYRDVGLLVPGNDPLIRILARHGLDVVKMLVLPLLVVGYGIVSSR